MNAYFHYFFLLQVSSLVLETFSSSHRPPREPLAILRLSDLGETDGGLPFQEKRRLQALNKIQIAVKVKTLFYIFFYFLLLLLLFYFYLFIFFFEGLYFQEKLYLKTLYFKLFDDSNVFQRRKP